MPWSIKKKEEKWCVFDKEGKVVACHVTRGGAIKQQRALYAKEGKSMSEQYSLLVPVKQFAEPSAVADELTWIHAVPLKTWHHPEYGEVQVTPEKAMRMLQNFKEGVRGQEIATDYEHGLDRAKGNKASGWIRDMDMRDDGLWWAVEFTEPAKQELQSDEWKYFSPVWRDEWEHPDTREVFQDVVIGGGLTNQPQIKGLQALNFSEVVMPDTQVVPGSPAEPTAEVAELEHAEPGTGTPPVPATTEEQENTGRALGDEGGAGGSRRNTPPDVDARLREILGLAADADIVKPIQDLLAEVAPLRQAAVANSERKAFSERWPDEARELARLRAKDIESEAKAFSERYANIRKPGTDEPTGKGFSTLVQGKLQNVHKRFSEGNPNINDVTDLVDAIAAGGIVDFTERGSARHSETVLSDNPAKAFSELVVAIQESDKVAYDKAVELAEQRHPAEFEAYRRSLPGRR